MGEGGLNDTSFADEPLRIDPGENSVCIFRIKSDIDQDSNGDYDGSNSRSNSNRNIVCEGMANSAGGSPVKQVNKIYELEHFANIAF